MNDYLSNLPVELLYKIYDNVSSFDILVSLPLVNKRLHLISLNYTRLRLDFSSLKKKRSFDLFCAQLPSISSRVVSLEFSNENDGTTPMKINYFFLTFININNSFSNLRSLSLCHINSNLWKTIKKSLKSFVSLTSMSIDTIHLFYVEKAIEFTTNLLKDLLFLSSTLTYLRLKAKHNHPVHISKLDISEQISSIEHLFLYNIRLDVTILASFLPHLLTVDVMLHLDNLYCTTPIYTFEYLKYLSIIVLSPDFVTIKRLLNPMKQLVHLIIVAYDAKSDVTDGTAWEQILISIVTFKFVFKFHKYIWNEELTELESFRSSFWLEKKHWYVAYDRCTISGFSILYSVPYFMNIFPWLNNIENFVTNSTRSKITSFENVRRLILTDQCKIHKDLRNRYTNLNNIYIKNPEQSFHLLLYDIVPFLDISKITTFSVGSCRFNINDDLFLQAMLSMPHLISICAQFALLKLTFAYQWPNITQLKIQDDISFTNTIDKDIHAFYHSFSRLEQLSFHHDTILDICQLLNNKLTSISNIMIEHPINAAPGLIDDFITRDWLEQKTYLHNFAYLCDKHNTVRLWF
ncbi:hypothetical protein I4U23_011870 [Adineta vaga]|nr:hypothetical protein I4U23_011870 [Adineta vaga]